MTHVDLAHSYKPHACGSRLRAAARCGAFAQDDATAARMGAAAREHVAERFSRSAFGAALDGYVRGLAAEARGVARKGS